MNILRNKWTPLVLAVIIAALLTTGQDINFEQSEQNVTNNSDKRLQQAFENREHELMISGRGRVEKVLRDDNDGSRHQRFIIKLASGQSLLIAHNIDIAPRVKPIKAGDMIEFHGMYEWNDRGGVIHWTHHDPDGSQEGGWLVHEGKRYE